MHQTSSHQSSPPVAPAALPRRNANVDLLGQCRAVHRRRQRRQTGQGTMQHKRRRAVLARHGLGGIDKTGYAEDSSPTLTLAPANGLPALSVTCATSSKSLPSESMVTACSTLSLSLSATNAHDKLATCPARHGRAGVVASTVELKRHRRAGLTRIGIANTQHARQRLASWDRPVVEPRIRHVAQALRAHNAARVSSLASIYCANSTSMQSV